jgi:hypothetical protein
MGMIPGNRRLLSLGLEAALILCVMAHAPRLAADEPPILRVRSTDQAIAEFIGLASTRSLTFRNLVSLIQTSDGIVYVEPGECGHGARACLKMWMGVGGSNRFLRVLVNRKRAGSDADFMGTIGHELQHSVEALSDPGTVTGLGLYNFFDRTAPTGRSRFETVEAIKAGDAVRRELSGFRLR